MRTKGDFMKLLNNLLITIFVGLLSTQLCASDSPSINKLPKYLDISNFRVEHIDENYSLINENDSDEAIALKISALIHGLFAFNPKDATFRDGTVLNNFLLRELTKILKIIKTRPASITQNKASYLHRMISPYIYVERIKAKAGQKTTALMKQLDDALVATYNLKKVIQSSK